MKIGLMTWFRYNNYGTILQAYALQKTLENYNYDVVLIDYKPRGTVKNINNIQEFIKLISNKIKDNKYIVNNSTFNDFINNYLKISNQCNNYYSLKGLSDELDAVICGSDQIWSSNNFDINYFLPFVDSSKKMSYSPSFGKNSINNEEISLKMKKLINDFDIISVREKTGKKIIKGLCNKEATITLDPTLLLDKKSWNILINNKLDNELKKKKYILCYFLGDSSKYVNCISKFAKQNNFEIINIPTLKNQKINIFSLDNDVSPKDFITLIKNASIVLTDSFHGTIFSIIYEHNFYTFKRFKDSDIKSQNSRVVDLLNELNLSDRLLEIDNAKIENKTINYNSVGTKLDTLKKDSLNFLLNGLDKIKKNNIKPISSNITNLCCGCGACSAICSKGTINITINDEGFFQYDRDNEKCINCNLCQKVCPMNNIEARKITSMNKCYYFKSSNKQILKESSSGGAGYEIANYYNSLGYYVCGAFYDKVNKRTKHIIINPNSTAELKKIQGSKYLQSYTYDAFKELLTLPKDAKVVFFGTPCQVSAVDKITKLKKIRTNYILVDLICHGVPSYYLWNKYLNEINEKYHNNDLINVKFRNKKYGWKDRRISIYNNKISYNKKDTKDLFYKFFREGFVDNNCCYECPFRSASSADIKIGDYWKPEYFSDKEGASMIITISSVGEEIIKKLSKNNIILEKNINDFFKYQYTDNMSPNIWREKIIEELKTDKKLSNIYYDYFKFDDLKNAMTNLYNKIRRR